MEGGYGGQLTDEDFGGLNELLMVDGVASVEWEDKEYFKFKLKKGQDARAVRQLVLDKLYELHLKIF